MMTTVIQQRLIVGSIAALALAAVAVFVVQLLPTNDPDSDTRLARQRMAMGDSLQVVQGDIHAQGSSSGSVSGPSTSNSTATSTSSSLPDASASPVAATATTPPVVEGHSPNVPAAPQNADGSAQMLASINSALERNDVATAQRLLDRYHTLYGSSANAPNTATTTTMNAASPSPEPAVADADVTTSQVSRDKPVKAHNARREQKVSATTGTHHSTRHSGRHETHRHYRHAMPFKDLYKGS